MCCQPGAEPPSCAARPPHSPRPGASLRSRRPRDSQSATPPPTGSMRIDGTETRVRRPRANRPGRRAFVSGKRKQNTIKTTTISDGQGRTLWAGAARPGRMHDQTAVNTEGIEELLRYYPTVTAGWTPAAGGFANGFRDRVCAPPPRPSKDARPRGSPPTGRHARGSRPGGSVSSTPSPSTSSGDPPNATSDAARPTPKRMWPFAGLVSDRAARR